MLFKAKATSRETIPKTTMAHIERSRLSLWSTEGLFPQSISTINIVLGLNKVLSAEDITAETRAARTRPPRSGEKTPLVTIGKACSGEILGNKVAAPMPNKVIAKAMGIRKSAVQNVEALAVLSSLAQNSREYMSGPTT